MIRTHGMTALALALLVCGGAAIAASPSDTITARQANFKAMGKGMKAVIDQLKAETPSVDAIKAGAAAIKMAAPKVAGYFPKGTGPEAGVKTGALPAIWEKGAEFKADADKLVAAANALDAAAATGDMAKIKPAFMAVGGTCKGCHETFRQKD